LTQGRAFAKTSCPPVENAMKPVRNMRNKMPVITLLKFYYFPEVRHCFQMRWLQAGFWPCGRPAVLWMTTFQEKINKSSRDLVDLHSVILQ